MHDATALAAAISDGRTTASAVMEASLTACQTQAHLGAVVYQDVDRAHRLADAADAVPMPQRGPFHGLPFLAKDLGATAAGLPIAAGSAALRATAQTPAHNSDLFGKFSRSGLLAFGVTATPPFGLDLACAPDGLPEAHNPWNPALTPGGSSGGAAAAVASGCVAIAHATDAAGSIRVPAACCGLTGLKPSRGAIPGGPDFGNHLMGIASELVLARSVRDVRTAFASCCLPLPSPDLPDSPRIGLALPDRCDDRHRAATRAAADALQDAGCTISHIDPPDTLGQEAHSIARTILSVSLADWLAALFIPDADLPPLVAAVAQNGRTTPATTLFAVTRQMEHLTARALALMDDFDAILMPVLSTTPPAIGAQAMQGHDPAAHFDGMERFAPNAALANVAGLCGLALPFGMAADLPVGVQLMARPGADLNLCTLAAMIETRAPTLIFPSPIAGHIL